MLLPSFPYLEGLVQTYKVLALGFVVHPGGQTSFWYDKWLPEGPLYNLVTFVHISESKIQVRDIWDIGRWLLNILFIPLLENVVNLLNSKFVWLHHNV